MFEIPISVKVPPDGLSDFEENAWGKEQHSDGPGLAVAEQIDIGYGVASAFNFAYYRYVGDVTYEERAKINAIAEARKWDKEAAKASRESSKALYLGFKKGYEKDAAKAARSARDYRQSAISVFESFHDLVEHEIASRRQALWGDPDMSDLGLDLRELEDMQDSLSEYDASSAVGLLFSLLTK